MSTPRRNMSSAWLALASIRATTRRSLFHDLAGVVGLGKTAQHLVLVHGTADPDIIGGRFDQSIEYDIAGKAENVVHAVVLAPRHCLLSAVMAAGATSRSRCHRDSRSRSPTYGLAAHRQPCA